MNQLLIHPYLDQLADLREVSGTHRECFVREPFKGLAKPYASEQSLSRPCWESVASKTKARSRRQGAMLWWLRLKSRVATGP